MHWHNYMFVSGGGGGGPDWTGAPKRLDKLGAIQVWDHIGRNCYDAEKSEPVA